MTRTGIYARISDDSRGTGLGVARQLDDCRKIAGGRGWQVIEEYVDNDVSATSGRPRPEYQRLLADIRARRLEALIVWDTDRLTRTPRELEDIIDLADSHGLALASVGGEIDLSTPQGRLTARIKGSVARHETDQLSRRIKRKLQENAEAGRPHGFAPWGWRRVYEYSPSGGRTGPACDVVDEDAAAIIREATRRLLAGESLRAVAKGLNETGKTSPRGHRWNSTTLKQVLLRPTNAGLRTYRGEVIGAGQAEAIISEDRWRAVVALLTDPSRKTGGGAAPVHLLSGIARCGRCGGHMRYFAGVVRNDKRQPAAYGCRECFKIRRKASLVDEAVEAVALELLKRPETLAVLARQDPERVREAQERVQGIQGRMAEAADGFAEGDITAAQLKRINERLRPQLDEAMQALSVAAPSDEAASLAGADAEARWAAASIDVRREVVDRLMSVTVLPLGAGKTATYENSVRIEPKGSPE